MVHYQPGEGIDPFTGTGQTQAAGLAHHKLDVEAAFQRPQALCYRRLPDTKRTSGLGHATTLDDLTQGRQRLQIRQLFVFHTGMLAFYYSLAISNRVKHYIAQLWIAGGNNHTSSGFISPTSIS